MAADSVTARAHDWRNLLAAFYRASFVEMTKSPSNLWLSTAIQIFYYAAQFLFWAGVRNNAAGARFISDFQLQGFLLTLLLADNLYGCFLGPGSSHAAAVIAEGALEPYLLWPRSALGVLVFSRPNWSYIPCVLVSAVAATAYYAHYHIPAGMIVLHLTGVIIGVFVLDAISFIYRLSAFWTLAIIQIRNSNPSFKIMVRPLSAFSGKLRLILLTVFPALFITGVPASILTRESAPVWLAAAAVAAGVLWVYVAFLWSIGVRRYGRLAS